MSNKSITESTVSELIERRKKHDFMIKLIDAELLKKGGRSEQKRSPPKEKKSPKEASNDKKKSSMSATRDNMKIILEKHQIEFKSNMTKGELEGLIKKHNLVRIVEEYHKNK